MKTSGPSLVEKEVHENMVPPNTTQMLPQHVTCKAEICTKEKLLLSGTERKKVKRGYSYISFTPTQRRKIKISQTVEKLLVYCSFFYDICHEAVFITFSVEKVSKQFICCFSAPVIKVNCSFSIASVKKNRDVSFDSPEECNFFTGFMTPP